MSGAPKHTFVIMGYQTSKYIEECYEALEKQTIKSEILMTSSTPNDFQRSFAKERNIPYIVNPVRNGFAGDLNFAYAQAKTDYVTMVHQDDILAPSYAERCVEAGEKAKDTLIIFTNYYEYKNGEVIDSSLNLFVKRLILGSHYLFKNSLRSRFFKRSLLSFGNPISCPSICYAKKNIGDLEFSTEYKVSPEWEALLRLARKKGSFVFVREKLHYYRLHEGQITSVGLANRIAEDEKVFYSLWPAPIAKSLCSFYSFCYPKAEKED